MLGPSNKVVLPREGTDNYYSVEAILARLGRITLCLSKRVTDSSILRSNQLKNTQCFSPSAVLDP